MSVCVSKTSRSRICCIIYTAVHRSLTLIRTYTTPSRLGCLPTPSRQRCLSFHPLIHWHPQCSSASITHESTTFSHDTLGDISIWTCFVMFHQLSHMVVVAALSAPAPQTDCLKGAAGPIVFHDMHDGDLKQVVPVGVSSSFRILPFNNTQKWVVEGTFDTNCVATIDFDVPNKPNPPPVKLAMTLWSMQTTQDIGASLYRFGLEFTDPSGTLAPSDTPLNVWLQDETSMFLRALSHTTGGRAIRRAPCLAKDHLIVNDMHDGDAKSLDSDRNALQITPYKNNQRWTIAAKFNNACVATIDFNVHGKPNPPPVDLAARVWTMKSTAGAVKDSLLFTDPSSTLAPPSTPLNIWVPNNSR
eukprot:m.167505 g.167505  ORF g.167505 m.167505 type:complete len:358 (+) comp12832_c0_seq1:104-1177(+)